MCKYHRIFSACAVIFDTIHVKRPSSQARPPTHVPYAQLSIMCVKLHSISEIIKANGKHITVFADIIIGGPNKLQRAVALQLSLVCAMRHNLSKSRSRNLELVVDAIDDGGVESHE